MNITLSLYRDDFKDEPMAQAQWVGIVEAVFKTQGRPSPSAELIAEIDSVDLEANALSTLTKEN